MDDFYYDLLHIRKQEKNLKEGISFAIKETRTEYDLVNSTDGLCKVSSLLLHQKMNESEIENIILNTKELMGGGYEHEALLVRGKENGLLSYYLVDLTFSQFLNNGAVLRDFFRKWPVDVLLNDYPEFVCNLLNFGFSSVTSDQLTAYFFSINQFASKDFLIEDLDRFFLNQKFRKI